MDNCFNNKFECTTRKLSEMLYGNYFHAQSFRMARDILKEWNVSDLKICLISEHITDGRIYNQPIISEVVALIVRDVDTVEKRDIIMQKQYSELQRIDEYHTRYLGYQYPLLFPYGEDSYRPNVKHRDNCSNIHIDPESQNLEIQHEDVPWGQSTKRN